MLHDAGLRPIQMNDPNLSCFIFDSVLNKLRENGVTR